MTWISEEHPVTSQTAKGPYKLHCGNACLRSHCTFQQPLSHSLGIYTHYIACTFDVRHSSRLETQKSKYYKIFLNAKELPLRARCQHKAPLKHAITPKRRSWPAGHPALFAITLLTNLCPGKQAVDNKNYINYVQQYVVCRAASVV